MPKFNKTNVFWLIGYLLVIAGLFIVMTRYRANAIDTYGTPEAKANWQAWRDAAETAGEEGWIDRSRPASSDPPSLVLMRDHFYACLGISWLLTSCLYVWLMVCARGAMKPVTLHLEDD